MELENILDHEKMKEIGKKVMENYVKINPSGQEFLVLFYDKENPDKRSEKADTHYKVNFKNQKHIINFRAFPGVEAYNKFVLNGMSKDNFIVRRYKKTDGNYKKFI